MAFCCCLSSEIFTSPPNGNVALLTLCVGTAVSGFGYLLHSHSLPVGQVMRNRTAAARHKRAGCRCIGYRGSCVSYSPRLASVCHLTQGPKKEDHCYSSLRRGWGRWWGMGYISKRNSTSVTHRLPCSRLVVDFNVYRDMGTTPASPDRAA